jgi:tight adherence protein B
MSVLLLEGAYLLWNDSKGPEAQRLERRLRTLSAGTHGEEALKLLKGRASGELPWLDRTLMQIPRLAGLDRILEQAGLTMSVSRFVLISLAVGLGAIVVIGVWLAPPFWFRLGIGVGAGLLPYAWVAGRRRKRLTRIEQDLPDAVDLIARALRAGHAFPSALQMVGSEMMGPIATEFRITSEEVNFGVAIDAAFMNLATRVPSDDVRFFVIAVLLQRETGGNLAELLQNIAKLVRERFHLLGKVRVLAAEGKMSAWVLTGLPIATAFMINLVHPTFMAVLWKDPVGLKMVYACVLMMLFGIVWMWRTVKIRV